jgi:hypothetical protein
VPCFRFGPSAASCRVQIFEADDLDPVFVVVQSVGEGGSLINRSESLVAAIWDAYTPAASTPPTVVGLLLSEDLSALPGDGNRPLFLIRSEVAAADLHYQHGLHTKVWARMSPEELSQVVGCDVDLTRGPGYTYTPPTPLPCCGALPDEVDLWFAVANPLRFPRTRPFRTDGCMPEVGPGLFTRLRRRVTPNTAARSCCWYHGGDWRVVCAAAVAVLTRIRRDGCTHPLRVLDRAATAPERELLDDWQRQAYDSLFHDPMIFGAQQWTNGQHRGQAILDAGVTRTITGTPE